MNRTHPTATLTTDLPGSTKVSFKSLSMKGVKVIMFAAFLVLTASQMQVMAQTGSPTPTPESEQIMRLKEEKTRAELEQAIAEARKKTLEAEFPKPTATPLEGKTEVDSGVKLESEMLAYRSMSTAADQIVDEIKNRNKIDIATLAIHNDRDLKALLGYMVIMSQLELMEKDYENSIVGPFPLSAKSEFRTFGPTTVSEGLSAAQSILGSFIDLIALLRTDTNIKGMDFSIEESALVSELFRALRNGYGANIKLLYPAMFPPSITMDKQFTILGKIQQLYLIRERAAALAARIEKTEEVYADTKDEIAGLEKKLKVDKENLPLLDKELERLQKIYWRWRSSRLAERIEEVIGQIAKLRDEIRKLPAAIAESKANLNVLNERLNELYDELLRSAPRVEVLDAINVAQGKVIAAEGLLGRAFLPAEIEFLFTEFPDAIGKKIVAEAEAHNHRKLTDVEKEQLLAPLSGPEQTALKSLYDAEKAKGGPLTDDEKLAVLTEADQRSLLSDAEQAALRELKKVSLARLQALNDQFDKLKAELIRVDNGAGINALTSYLQAENLRDALGCAGAVCAKAYILQLKVVRAGGNNRIKRNLLKDVFAGPSISHSGGAIIEYILYDTTGVSKSSKTVAVYSGYFKAKDIQ